MSSSLGTITEKVSMVLPRREWFTLNEAAIRWRCSIADIAGWADADKFRILTGIAPVRCEAEVVAGKVVLAPMDLLPLFRRCGSGPTEGLIRRVQPYGRQDWLIITDPPGGIIVAVADMLIAHCELRRFEDAHDLLDRDDEARAPSDDGDYDWSAMHVEITRRVFEEGLPPSQGAWVRELQDWFSARSADGSFPDESSIRRRLKPILDALKFKKPKR